DGRAQSVRIDLQHLRIGPRAAIGTRPDLAETILRAFLLRRTRLQASGSVGVLIVGSRYSAEALRLREFLARSRYPMTWQDVESSPDAGRLLEEFKVGPDETPLVVLPNGKVLRKPTTEEMAAALGVVRPVEDEIVDVVIIGAGPGGLAAAVYGASEGLRTLVIDSAAPGGQAGTSSRIENYMGFPFGISGQDLADGAIIQAEKFGASLVAPAYASRLTCAETGPHTLEVAGVGTIVTRCVVIATGATYRKLDVPRLKEFEGRGIYYAATQVERTLCGTAPVAVVGAGNSAGQAAVFMAENGGHVFLVVRGTDLARTMSSYLVQRIESLEGEGKVTVLLQSQITELHGEERLEGVTIHHASGESRTEPILSIFVMIGALPCTDWLKDSRVVLDEKGFIYTGNDLVQRELWTSARPPFFLETSCPGVFAVGDSRSGSVKRVASAVGEGSMAIALAHQYLSL
ncbi:FAD-binding protein, partial [bacterium]